MTTPEPSDPGSRSDSPLATPAGIPSADAIARLANAFFQALPDLPVTEAVAPAVVDLVPGVLTPPSTRPTPRAPMRRRAPPCPVRHPGRCRTRRVAPAGTRLGGAPRARPPRR